MRVITATSNLNKVREIAQILSFCEVIGYRDYFGYSHECIEDGETFEQNAVKKLTVVPPVSDFILSDDSGLEIMALNGEPGVYSARYGGDDMTDVMRCHLVLQRMAMMTNREARFVCVMALRDPLGNITIKRGDLDGYIANDYNGDNGFGYDPIFIPRGFDCTLATVSPTEKNAMSHRMRALMGIGEYIRKWGVPPHTPPEPI